MEKMIVTIFNTEAAAYDGVAALKALNDGGDITLYATAVLAKDADGKVSVKQTSGTDRRFNRMRPSIAPRKRHQAG